MSWHHLIHNISGNFFSWKTWCMAEIRFTHCRCRYVSLNFALGSVSARVYAKWDMESAFECLRPLNLLSLQPFASFEKKTHQSHSLMWPVLWCSPPFLHLQRRRHWTWSNPIMATHISLLPSTTHPSKRIQLSLYGRHWKELHPQCLCVTTKHTTRLLIIIYLVAVFFACNDVLTQT